MKNKSTTAWIVIGVVLAIVAIIVLVVIYSKKDINWQEHYSKNSKDPYGLFLIKELLKDEYGENTEIIVKALHKDLPTDTNETGNNYLFIGSQLYLNNIDQKALFTFIENGNTAFIATKELPYSISYLLKQGGTFVYDSIEHSIIYPIQTTSYLIPDTTYIESNHLDSQYTDTESGYPDSLYADPENYSANPPVEEQQEDFFEEDYTADSAAVVEVDSIVADSNIAGLSYIDDKEVQISLFKPLANSPKEYVYKNPKVTVNNDTIPYHWLGIYGDSQLHASCIVLSKLCSTNRDSMNTLIGIPYGKGMLYVYTTPMLFTNFQLKESKGFNHAREILSVLSPGKLYWDEVSGLQNDNADGPESPRAYLKYILSKEALRWAWYLLIAATIIYILFESERKQRIIPVTETVTNTSIEYVHTTGRLYAQIGNHRKLIQLNMRLFLSSIQQKYGISVNLDDTDSIQWLAAKSGIPAERYEALQVEYKRITIPGHDIKTKDLHTFYKNMQFIYQKLHN